MTGDSNLEIDHVIAVVTDLEDAAGSLLEQHGLASVPGGRHPGHGTGNRIVPLGGSYLELMAPVDLDEAAGSPLGRWAVSNAADQIVPRALCLRTDDIDTVASILGEESLAMSRIAPDGTQLAWALAGLDGMVERGLPFFIEWHIPPDRHPGSAPAKHRSEPRGIESVVIGIDDEALAGVLSAVPGLLVEGTTGVHRVAIATEAGPVVI